MRGWRCGKRGVRLWTSSEELQSGLVPVGKKSRRLSLGAVIAGGVATHFKG